MWRDHRQARPVESPAGGGLPIELYFLKTYSLDPLLREPGIKRYDHAPPPHGAKRTDYQYRSHVEIIQVRQLKPLEIT